MAAGTDSNRRIRVRGTIALGWAFLALAVAGCGETRTLGDLTVQARSRDSSERTRAIRALGERSSEAETVAPILVECLGDGEAFVRRDAARALGRLGPGAKSAVPALRVAARDRNAHVRSAATDAIRKVELEEPHASRQR